jgi:hypothetical protein
MWEYRSTGEDTEAVGAIPNAGTLAGVCHASQILPGSTLDWVSALESLVDDEPLALPLFTAGELARRRPPGYEPAGSDMNFESLRGREDLAALASSVHFAMSRCVAATQQTAQASIVPLCSGRPSQRLPITVDFPVEPDPCTLERSWFGITLSSSRSLRDSSDLGPELLFTTPQARMVFASHERTSRAPSVAAEASTFLSGGEIEAVQETQLSPGPFGLPRFRRKTMDRNEL